MALTQDDKNLLSAIRNGYIAHLTGRAIKPTPRDEVMKKVEERMAKKKSEEKSKAETKAKAKAKKSRSPKKK